MTEPMNFTVTGNSSYNGSMELTGARPLQLANFICYQVLSIPISLVGVIGNILCIYVWTRKSMQWGVSSTSCYLVVLSISDLLYLIVTNVVLLMPRYLRIEKAHFVNMFHIDHHLKEYLEMGQPIANIFANISVFTVVAFTVERYIAIRFPIKGMVMCTPRQAIYILAIGAVAVLILHIPDIMEIIPAMKRLGYAESSIHQIGYNWGIMVLLFAVTPLLILIVFNTLLVRSVYISKQIRRRLTSRMSIRGQSDYTVLTITIILVVIFFLVCHAPAAVILCISTYKRQMNLIEDHAEEHQWLVAFAGANLLTIINSSFNFLIYSFSSAKFRTIAMRFLMYPTCRKKQLAFQQQMTVGTDDTTLYSSKNNTNRVKYEDKTKNNSENEALVNGRAISPEYV